MDRFARLGIGLAIPLLVVLTWCAILIAIFRPERGAVIASFVIGVLLGLRIGRRS